MCCVCVRVCAHIGNSRPPRGMIGGRGRVSVVSAVARRRAARSGVLAHIALSAPAGPNRWFPLVPLYRLGSSCVWSEPWGLFSRELCDPA
eukprot:scaffold19792_cov71-Phaeocystis_antarctica.AAC.1